MVELRLKPDAYWKIGVVVSAILFLSNLSSLSTSAYFYNEMGFVAFNLQLAINVTLSAIGSLVLLFGLFFFFLKKRIGFYLALVYAIFFEIILSLVPGMWRISQELMFGRLEFILEDLGYLAIPLAIGFVLAFSVWKSKSLLVVKEPEPKTYWKTGLVILALFSIASFFMFILNIANFVVFGSPRTILFGFADFALSFFYFLIAILACLLFFKKNKIGYYLALIFAILFQIIAIIIAPLLSEFIIVVGGEFGLGSLMLAIIRIAIAVILLICVKKSKPLFEKAKK